MPGMYHHFEQRPRGAAPRRRTYGAGSWGKNRNERSMRRRNVAVIVAVAAASGIHANVRSRQRTPAPFTEREQLALPDATVMPNQMTQQQPSGEKARSCVPTRFPFAVVAFLLGPGHNHQQPRPDRYGNSAPRAGRSAGVWLLGGIARCKIARRRAGQQNDAQRMHTCTAREGRLLAIIIGRGKQDEHAPARQHVSRHPSRHHRSAFTPGIGRQPARRAASTQVSVRHRSPTSRAFLLISSRRTRAKARVSPPPAFVGSLAEEARCTCHRRRLRCKKHHQRARPFAVAASTFRDSAAVGARSRQWKRAKKAFSARHDKYPSSA